MKYQPIIRGVFLSRPNRFLAKAEINGGVETVHVINTGRMRELLIPGAAVYLRESQNPARKTKYDLVGVCHNGGIVNVDSLAPNRVAAEFIPTLFPGATQIRPETAFGKSRFDFYVEDKTDKIFLEVKGVTLKIGSEARFPDAPTQRGTKHLLELIEAKKAGFRAVILFVVAREDTESFSPNEATDPAFATALRKAVANGVEAFAVDCAVTADSLTARRFLPVVLEKTGISR